MAQKDRYIQRPIPFTELQTTNRRTPYLVFMKKSCSSTLESGQVTEEAGFLL
jgi:hypothetical protein